MKRRSFLASILALPAIFILPKAVIAEVEDKPVVIDKPLSYRDVATKVVIKRTGIHPSIVWDETSYHLPNAIIFVDGGVQNWDRDWAWTGKRQIQADSGDWRFVETYKVPGDKWETWKYIEQKEFFECLQ